MSGWPGFYLENWIYFLKREHIEFPFFKKKKNHLQYKSYVTCNIPFIKTYLGLPYQINTFKRKERAESNPLFVMTVQLEQELTEHREEKQTNPQVHDCSGIVWVTEKLVFILNQSNRRSCFSL